MSELAARGGKDSAYEEKPIGGNENDFEAVLVDGCLGFSLSLGNAALVIINAIWYADFATGGGFIAVCAAVVAAVLLKAMQLLTDRVQNGSPQLVLVICHAVSFVVAVAGMGLGFRLVSVVGASVGAVITALLYGRYLAALMRKALMLVVDVVFMYLGVVLLILSQIPLFYTSVVLAVSALISILAALSFIGGKYQFGEMISAADSKSRSIKVKGNNHTLFLLGFMLGAALLLFSLGLSADTRVVVLGFAVGLAGILSLMTRQFDERVFKESLKKSMAFVAALLLLPLALLPEEVKAAFLACYVCFVTLNIIVLLNAVVETTRFNMISPMWLLGQEGSVFFSGLAVGGALFAAFPYLAQVLGVKDALLFVCVVCAVVCAWMQIRVNYQIYPFEPVIEEKVDDEMSVQIEQEGRRKVLWHQKIDVACERYRLSPREREILRILLKGRDAKYIMDTFYISQSTAKTHIYNIYRKFGIHSRQELLDFVEEIDLTESDENVADEKAEEEDPRF